MLTKRLVLGILSVIMLGSVLATPTFAAQTWPVGSWWGGNQGASLRQTTIVGQVSSINDAVLKVTSRGSWWNNSGRSYEVNVSRAAIWKNGARSSVSKIKVGDMVTVNGSLGSGDSLTARTVTVLGSRGNYQGNYGSPISVLGNGEPIILGTLSSVDDNDDEIRIRNNHGTYTVDISEAKVKDFSGRSLSISDLDEGDQLIVQGEVRGNDVEASLILNQTGNWFNQLFGL